MTSVAELLKVAQSNRSVASTKLNAQSSRSHSVFMLRVSAARTAPSRNGAPGKLETRNSTLVMVDLAGSERVEQSGAQGEQMKEAQAINKSLSALRSATQPLSHSASDIKVVPCEHQCEHLV